MPRSPQTPTLADWGELRFLRWLRGAAKVPAKLDGAAMPIGIGDDCAHLRLTAGPDLLLKTDMLVEGVDFKHGWITPRELGAKAMTENLSDLAAMAARPVAALLSLGVPPSTPVADLKAFIGGVLAQGRRWGCVLAGGDLGRAPVWSINLMLVGRPAVGTRVIRRRDARPGMTLYVTGTPGESAGGLDALIHGNAEKGLIIRHNRPTPRLREAEVLARVCGRIAMLDVSDGIWTDAGHLAEESGAAIEIDLARLPVTARLRRYAALRGFDPLDWVLYGGEDYELLFATDAAAEKIKRAFARAGLKTRVTAIGRVTKGRGVCLIDGAGRRAKRINRTFRHFK